MKKVLILLLLALSSLYLIFSVRTNVFFSLDDFSVLAYFKSHSTIAMIKQFLLYGDLWGFRKIIGYLNLRFLYSFFGVNPVPYIINNQIIHSANVVLMFLILSLLSKDNLKSFFFAIIFNSLYLFYFSNVHEYLVTFLCLLSIYFYLNSRRHLSLAIFLLALLTKEIALGLPLILLSINYFRNKKTTFLTPFYDLALLYLIFQLGFVLAKTAVSPDNPYATTFHLATLWRNFLFYIPLPWLTVFTVALIFSIRKRTFFFFIFAILTLAPALILKNRHEGYYLYLPLAYLCFFLGLTLPKFSRTSLVIYAAIFLLFGGRKLLPPIAHQEFTNWQKDSIDNALESIAAGKLPDGDKLERDAKLMMETNTFDLFLPKAHPAVY